MNGVWFIGKRLLGLRGAVGGTKRIAFVVGVLGLLVFLVVAVLSPNPNAPQFQKLPGNPAISASAQISYFLSPPGQFEDRKLWITILIGRTNKGVFLYDLDRRRVIGQALKGSPVLTTGTPPKSLCLQSAFGLRERLGALLESIRLRLFKAKPPGAAMPVWKGNSRFWLLDLEKNSAVRIGRLQGWTDSFVPSPDAHWCYATLSRFPRSVDLYCFDLKSASLKQLDAHSLPAGWWDNTHILLQTTNQDWVLHDIATDKTTPFIRSNQVAEFLRDQGIAEAPKWIQANSVWNGRENDCYLRDGNGVGSYLIKLERPDGKLKLVSRASKVEADGQLDRTGRYLVYNGHYASRMDGVFVRDLQDGEERTLVAPAGLRVFSQPKLYGDLVLYVRSNALWQINLDGSNHLRLFPPPETALQTK
jgi:hypothetical protein